MPVAMNFKKVKFSLETGELLLEYSLDGKYNFVEKFIFPNAPFILDSTRKEALDKVGHFLHIAAGISYYKAFLPDSVILEDFDLTADEARFFEKFYITGLGEFAVRNNVDFFSKVKFPYKDGIVREQSSIEFSPSALVPIGGGKDSSLAIELLKEIDFSATTIACGEPKPIKQVMERTGCPAIIIKRQIDPELIRLSNEGKVLNGHVPITGILAFMLWAAAILYDKKYVIMACERSANQENTEYLGVKINHQYSKSYDFEKDFYALTQKFTPEFRYFSLLRPISEIHIAKLFADKCKDYFDVFTSCNKAFKLDENKRLSHWCGECDKCRFVFLVLAMFMDKQKLIDVLGGNPLDDENQIKGYEELLGLSGHKPFECVGTYEECNYAFYKLSQKREWQNDKVIAVLKDRVKPVDAGDLFIPKGEHLIPKEFDNVLAEFRK